MAKVKFTVLRIPSKADPGRDYSTTFALHIEEGVDINPAFQFTNDVSSPGAVIFCGFRKPPGSSHTIYWSRKMHKCAQVSQGCLMRFERQGRYKLIFRAGYQVGKRYIWTDERTIKVAVGVAPMWVLWGLAATSVASLAMALYMKKRRKK